MEINKGIKLAIMEDMVEKEEIQRRKGLSVLTVELLVILQTNATNCMVIHQVISLKGNLLLIRFLVQEILGFSLPILVVLGILLLNPYLVFLIKLR